MQTDIREELVSLHIALDKRDAAPITLMSAQAVKYKASIFFSSSQLSAVKVVRFHLYLDLEAYDIKLCSYAYYFPLVVTREKRDRPG